MISLKTSLKKLYNKVTGKKTNKESISEIVNQLADDYTGGGETYAAGTGIEITDENVINNTQNNVVANPTLEGNEDLLNGLQVGDTKYAMPHLYQHIITAINHTEDYDDYIVINIINTSSTPLSLRDITSSDVPNFIGAYNSSNENTPSITITNIVVYSDGDVEFFSFYDNASINTVNTWNVNSGNITISDDIVQLF